MESTFVNIGTGDHLPPNWHQGIAWANTDIQFYYH